MTARRLLIGLLALSGVTHLSQLAVYEHTPTVLGSATFGAAYLLIALALWRNWRGALPAAIIAPTIGGICGIIRLFAIQPNPFSVFHPLLDMIIVPLAITLFGRSRTARAESEMRDPHAT